MRLEVNHRLQFTGYKYKFAYTSVNVIVCVSYGFLITHRTTKYVINKIPKQHQDNNLAHKNMHKQITILDYIP